MIQTLFYVTIFLGMNVFIGKPLKSEYVLWKIWRFFLVTLHVSIVQQLPIGPTVCFLAGVPENAKWVNCIIRSRVTTWLLLTIDALVQGLFNFCWVVFKVFQSYIGMSEGYGCWFGRKLVHNIYYITVILGHFIITIFIT